MIVVVNPSSKAGHSFKGLHAYCSHDQKRAQTSERVDWISTRNVAVEDPDQAWKVMAATAYAQNQLKQSNGIRAGQAPKHGAVMHVVMSFDKDEPTSPEAMQAAADALLSSLGADPAKMRAKNKPTRRQFADEHQAIMYAHSDTDNTHLHLMINRVHPQTGVVLPTNNDHNKAQAWALKYSKQHGTDKKTPARAENDEMRKDGEYVKADKRKTRNAYEQDQKNREAANDNKRLRSVLDEQRAKDADLQQRGRDLAKRKADDLAKLVAEHKERQAEVGRQLQTNINKSKAQARELYRPLHRELKEQQAAERQTFESLESSFFGRAANSFKTAFASMQDIGGHRRGFNLKTFKSATDAGTRKEYFDKAQERARRALELEQQRNVAQAAEQHKRTQQAAMAENRARLETERQALKQRQAEEENRLQQEWKARGAERQQAIDAVPAPAPKQTDIKSKARLAHVRKDYRAEFDKARQKPAPEQDNSSQTTDDSGDDGRTVQPQPAPQPEPLKKSYAEAQREAAEEQRKAAEAEQSANDNQESARAAYIAEQQSQTPEPPQDRGSYIQEQQQTPPEPEPNDHDRDR